MTQQDRGATQSHAERPTAEVIQEEAAGVGRAVADRGSEVAGSVGEQASRVASESTRQARNLLHEGKEQLSGQARQGQQRGVDGLRKVADQLHQMSGRSGGQGAVPEMARQVADRSRQAASWLENREPGDLVDEVRRYARRKPGTFLLGALAAGVVAGRMTRGAVDAARSDDTGSDSRYAGYTTQPSDYRSDADYQLGTDTTIGLPNETVGSTTSTDYTNSSAGGYR